ncbi:MAG: MBL fold metallo-hydrolase [Erysipelotrichaceae bacterium]|nr:MBL fold metallo-hydrolase [Erysipelotrichaceae bacterium]
MELKKIGERLYVLPYEERTDRPNLYYIKGDDYSIAIDAGNSRAHVEKFYAALKEMDFPLPRYTVISHWHWDHTFGLKYINGESISTQLTHDKLIEVGKWKWNLDAMKKREETGDDIPFCNEHILLEYPDLDEIEVVTTDITITENTTLDLGGINVELLPRDSTHSRDPIFVYLPSEKALIVQDADNFDFYHGEVYFQDKLKAMIAFFESLDYDKHLLGHAEYETKEFALERLRSELI